MSTAQPVNPHHHHTEELLKQIESTLETLKTVKEMVWQDQSCLDVLNQINGVFILSNALKPNNEHIASDARTIIKLKL